jgi:hypothetical protein
MPRINELPELSRLVIGSDTLIIETLDGTCRLPATSFKGDQGSQGLQGDQGLPGVQGDQGLQGLQGPPGTAWGIRETATFNSAILAPYDIESGIVDIAPSFELLQVILSAPARLRIYSSIAARDNDIYRTIFTRPLVGAGVILDINATSNLSFSLDPHAHGSSMESLPSGLIAYSITNNGMTGSITASILYLRKEQ